MRDTHSDNFEGTPGQTAVLEQAMTPLVAVLRGKGLLDQTLVVVGTEFGRMPRTNDNDGRDHNNKGFGCLLGGDGIKGGDFEEIPRSAAVLDQEMSALLPDLQAKGCWVRGRQSWAPSSA